MGSQVISVINQWASFWLLALFLSTVQTGIFSACMNLVLLSNPLLLGMSNILEPRLSRAFNSGGCEELLRVVKKVAVLMGVVMFCFAFSLFWAGEWLVHLLYADPAYSGNGTLITILASGMVLSGVSMSAGLALRPLQRTDLVFWIKLLNLVVSIIAVVLLIDDFGMIGVAYAFLLAGLFDCVLRYAVFFRELHRFRLKHNAA